MFEDKDREIPEVEFTFEEEQKDEEERNKEIEELIKKEMNCYLLWELKFLKLPKMSQMKKIVIIPGTEDRKNRYE